MLSRVDNYETTVAMFLIRALPTIVFTHPENPLGTNRKISLNGWTPLQTPWAHVSSGNSLPVAPNVTKAGGVPINAEHTVQGTPHTKHHRGGKPSSQECLQSNTCLPVLKPRTPNPRAQTLNPEPGP